MQQGSPMPPRKRLSIYPDPPAEILLLDTPSALEAQIGTARRAATAHLHAAHGHVQGLVSRWIGVENRVEHRIKALLPPDERLVPGALYVAVAILSGAIVARHRSLPARALLPPAAGTAAFAHFLPKTAANVRAYAGALEDAHLPGVAQTHETGKAHAHVAWERLRAGTARGREAVRRGVLGALDKVQGATGLKLREAIGVARAMEEQAAAVIEETVGDLQGVVEKKADDITEERLV
ncbi:apolipo protein O-domain-containing protein [Mycena pura]|uniref:MICOS complex subunit n=1 Tax=Mycena pura TaxID=153505 RepID=A0AAD6VP05_9AGAR|nr:apolipo protein O-domain-containing protein [Mycena pura]